MSAKGTTPTTSSSSGRSASSGKSGSRIPSSRASIAYGDTGKVPRHQEAAEMYTFATAKYVADGTQPYVPAGSFELDADPLSFVHSTVERPDMARHLEAVMLRFASPVADVIPADNAGMLNGHHAAEAGLDIPPLAPENDDNDSLLSLSDDDEPPRAAP